MAESDKNEIYLSPAPHIASPVTTKKLMIHVLIALAPLALYGIYLYGVPALIRIIVSVGVAVGAEAAFRKAMGKDIRIKDCSAAVTGLLLALVLPPLIPIWIVVVSAIFAIIVAKEFFGGLGADATADKIGIGILAITGVAVAAHAAIASFKKDKGE